MFLRKLFSGENKLGWVVVDLVIVIVGVYSAYLIQNYSEGKRVQQEKEEVLSALKYELEFFRVYLPGRSGYSANQVEGWNAKRDQGTYVDYSDWIFIRPQYAYQVIEYSIGIEENGVIDFPLHNALKTLYMDLKRLENTETKIMEVSMDYRSVSEALPNSSLSERHADNILNFQRFLRFFSSRAENQGTVAKKATEALDIINEQLGPQTRLKIEQDLIINNIDGIESVEQAIGLVKQVFPHFTEEEVRILYETSREE